MTAPGGMRRCVVQSARERLGCARGASRGSCRAPVDGLNGCWGTMLSIREGLGVCGFVRTLHVPRGAPWSALAPNLGWNYREGFLAG